MGHAYRNDDQNYVILTPFPIGVCRFDRQGPKKKSVRFSLGLPIGNSLNCVELCSPMKSDKPQCKNQIFWIFAPPSGRLCEQPKSFKSPLYGAVGDLRFWLLCRVVAPSGGATKRTTCGPPFPYVFSSSSFPPSSLFSFPFLSLFLFPFPFPFLFFFSLPSSLFLLLPQSPLLFLFSFPM